MGRDAIQLHALVGGDQLGDARCAHKNSAAVVLLLQVGHHLPADVTGALIKGEPRHPVIEDHVVIYAGATVLGRITVGRNSSIGGNVWLTQSVPPGSNITQAQTRTGRASDVTQ